MAKRRKGGLGKGLGSLMGDPSIKDEIKKKVSTAEIKLSYIKPNRFQPRTHFEDDALQELADSIKEHGIVQPLTVRKMQDNEYELIAGERRLRASKLAGLKTVPAYIRTANDEQMLEMALIENIQREDLNPIEIALSYQRMISELGLKQTELGKKVGKGRSSVTNYLGLIKLSEKIQESIKEGLISFGHAKVLMGAKDPLFQDQLFESILKDSLSVRKTEELAKAGKAKKAGTEAAVPGKATVHQIQIRDLEKKLRDQLGSKIKLSQKKSNGPGDLRVYFEDAEDLNRILELLDKG